MGDEKIQFNFFLQSYSKNLKFYFIDKVEKVKHADLVLSFVMKTW